MPLARVRWSLVSAVAVAIEPITAFAFDDDLVVGEARIVAESPAPTIFAAWAGEHFVVAWNGESAIYAARISRSGEVLDPGGRVLVPYAHLLDVEPVADGVVILAASMYSPGCRATVVNRDLEPSPARSVACGSQAAIASDGTLAGIASGEPNALVSVEFVSDDERVFVGHGGSELCLAANTSGFLVVTAVNELYTRAFLVSPESGVTSSFRTRHKVSVTGASMSRFLLGGARTDSPGFTAMYWTDAEGESVRAFDLQTAAAAPMSITFDGRSALLVLFSPATNRWELMPIPDGAAPAYPGAGRGILVAQSTGPVVLASDRVGTLFAFSGGETVTVRRIERGDGVPDEVDNCFGWPNPDQRDRDGNGIGDACDNGDFDEWRDPDDDCPSRPSLEKADSNRNGVGDACDPAFDWDADSITNDADNCPSTPNPRQTNLDHDAIGNACDADDDGDQIADAYDNCPLAWNPHQEDADVDFMGNPCDDSDDGDDIADVVDNCPLVMNDDQADRDGDGHGDACDDPTELFGIDIEAVPHTLKKSAGCAQTGESSALGGVLSLAPLAFFALRRRSLGG